MITDLVSNPLSGEVSNLIAPSALTPSPSLLAANTNLCLVGDSMTYGNGGQLWFYGWWLIAACNGIFNFPQTVGQGSSDPSGGNMGVSGNTTAQMAARKATIAAAVGDGVVIIGGGQNDTSGVTALDMIDNIEEVVAACEANSATICVMPVAPTTTVLGNTDLQTRKATFDAYWASRSGVTFLADTFSGMDYSSGSYSIDGVHETSLGAKAKADNIAVYLLALFEAGKTAYDAPYTPDLMPSDRKDFSTGWSLSNTTGASVAQSTGTLGGEPSKIFTISGTPSSQDTFRYRSTITHSILTGDEFVGMLRLSATNAAQDGKPVGIKGFWFNLFFGQIPWGTLAADADRGFSDALIDASFVNKIIRTASENAHVDNSVLTFDITLRLDTTQANDIRLEIAQPEAYQHS